MAGGGEILGMGPRTLTRRICPKTVLPASGCAAMAELAPPPGSSAGAGAKDLKEGRAKAPITLAFEGGTFMRRLITSPQALSDPLIGRYVAALRLAPNVTVHSRSVTALPRPGGSQDG
jgi:hypothetical protein